MSFGTYFGDYLTQLVRAVDIVNNDIRNSILSEVEDYLRRELDIEFFTFLIKQREIGNSEDDVNLITLCTTEWHRGGGTTNTRIKDNSGKYVGQVSLAFAEEKYLWIVSDTPERKLRDSTTYLDLMNNANSSTIPKYVAKTPRAIRTSIIFPVSFSDQGEADGVVNFESKSYLCFKQTIWDELNKIAKSIAILYERNQTYKALREDTIRATRALSQYRNVNFADVVQRRKSIFVAFSSRADRQVVGKIIHILEDYDAEVVLWSDISETGIITQSIIRQIQNSDYGLCYLSEPALGSSDSHHDFDFVDNPNVLFEAGMLSGRSINMENWIPIREVRSDQMPFDLSAARAILVPRRKQNGTNILNEYEFAQLLANRLNSLLR
jgi:hypothetical protein